MGNGCTKIKVHSEVRLGKSKPSKKYVLPEHPVIHRNAVKTEEDYSMILKALNGHFIFTSLSEEDKEVVSKYMELYTFYGGQQVMTQNSDFSTYYVVRSGTLEVLIDGKRVNKIHEGEGFGELALLHEKPSSATVRSIDLVTLWGIERKVFRKVIEDINVNMYEQNREFLEKVPLLRPLESEQKDKLAANLVTAKYKPGDKIVTEGETGQFLYIIREGTVSIQKGNQEIARCVTGNYFGDQALLYNALRTATCVAVEGEVKCVCLSRDNLQKVLGNNLQFIIEKNTIMEALNKSAVLSSLNSHQKEQIRQGLVINQFKGGDVVIRNSEKRCSKLYIVIEGNLKYAKTSTLLADRATCIGDQDITLPRANEDTFTDDIIAGNNNNRIGELTRYQFEVCIGGKFEEVVKENAATNVLMKVHLFKHLKSEDLKELFSIINIEKYTEGSTILKEGFPSGKIYIVKRGKVDLFKKNQLVRTVAKLDYFGERVVLFGSNNSEFTCVASGKVSLWVITNTDFTNLLNDSMRQQLLKRVEMEDEEISLRELVVVKLLGKGMFANVYLVTNPQREVYYALKVISRRAIEKFVIHEHVLLEKQILQLVDHPFIIKLVKTFKDEKRLYFLLEYVHGLSLDTTLKTAGLLTVSESQFYTGLLVLVLQYLHEIDVIYRDLKPENVMLDTEGYIKLIDFDTAKILKGRTYTIAGSPHYIAPEVIAGKGYNKSADVWSLGICLYEFLYGEVPFGDSEDDPYRIYEEILTLDLRFPEEPELSETTKDFISQLLSRFPEFRCSGPVETLKKHEWFSGFDWEALMKNRIPAPYKPDVGEVWRELEDSFEEDETWDYMISLESKQSEEELFEVCDTELEEFKKSIPVNWEEYF